MKINGLEYLKCNKEKLSIPDSLNLLPESFKIFLQFYKTGEEKDIYQFTKYKLPTGNVNFFRWEHTDKTSPWIIEGDRLLRLLSMNELIEEMKQYHEQINDWHQENLFLIGNTHGEGIFVKLTGTNAGSIYLYGHGTPHNGEEFYKTAENIFDLFHQIELKEDSENLKLDKLNPKKLKRNINEDYWYN